MAIPEDHIREAVDEALGPAWPHERRRAIRRWVISTAGRVVGGLLVLWAIGFVVHLVAGMTLPWVFFVFVGFMMTILAFSQPEGREHLRQE
jgi:hypothetical protein